MNIKTLTGPNIQAALGEARRQFGDDVLLLESQPPRDGQPARITIMVDQPAATTVRQPAASRPQPTAAQAPAPRFGYGAPRPQPRSQPSTSEERAPATASFSTRPTPRHAPQTATLDAPSGGSGTPPRRTSGGDGHLVRHQAAVQPGASARRSASTRTPSSSRPTPRPQGRGQLFPGAEQPSAAKANPPASKPSWKPLETLVERQMDRLHDRIDQMEQRFSETVIGASYRWAAHPLFAEMLQQGFQPGTLVRLFDALVQRGFQPATADEELRWALGQELRKLLEPTTPRQNVGTQLFIGPGGAGKTSLLLKLAKHAAFYGRRSTCVIVVEPEDTTDLAYQNPVELYRRFDLPVQSVRRPEEMYRALSRARRFDQILIDTPPLPSQPAEARKLMQQLKQICDVLVPLQVHFVLDATRVLDRYTLDTLKSLPLPVNAVALTHLDATPDWGRVAEWLMALKVPVHFAGHGPRVPEGVAAYSPSWFVEQLLQR